MDYLPMDQVVIPVMGMVTAYDMPHMATKRLATDLEDEIYW